MRVGLSCANKRWLFRVCIFQTSCVVIQSVHELSEGYCIMAWWSWRSMYVHGSFQPLSLWTRLDTAAEDYVHDLESVHMDSLGCGIWLVGQYYLVSVFHPAHGALGH